jgi:DNA-binding IclR family transcriptional regulator
VEAEFDTLARNDEPTWTFLTNHSHVLICLASDPFMRLRDVAVLVGITERAVQRIVGDLEKAKVLSREKDGRRNRYAIDLSHPLRHAVERHRTVGDILGPVLEKSL